MKRRGVLDADRKKELKEIERTRKKKRADHGGERREEEKRGPRAQFVYCNDSVNSNLKPLDHLETALKLSDAFIRILLLLLLRSPLFVFHTNDAPCSFTLL